MDKSIAISVEEYKALLEIKGRYEQLERDNMEFINITNSILHSIRICSQSHIFVGK